MTKLSDIDFYEESNRIIEEVKEYLITNHSEFTTPIHLGLNYGWDGDFPSKVTKEIIEVVRDYLANNFEITDEDNIDEYVENAMIYIDPADIVSEMFYQRAMTFSEKLSEVGMSIKDFI